MITSLLERLLAKSAPEGDCLVWTGTRHRQGYGRVWVEGRTRLVHRLAYIERHGPIPKGLVVRHSCDNPPCFADEHLLLGTQRQNMLDRTSKLTHCKHGHSLADAYVFTNQSGNQSRKCRTCALEREAAKWRERQAC